MSDLTFWVIVTVSAIPIVGAQLLLIHSFVPPPQQSPPHLITDLALKKSLKEEIKGRISDLLLMLPECPPLLVLSDSTYRDLGENPLCLSTSMVTKFQGPLGSSTIKSQYQYAFQQAVEEHIKKMDRGPSSVLDSPSVP